MKFQVARTRCEENKQVSTIYVSGKSVATTSLSVSNPTFRKWYKRAAMKSLTKFEDALFDQVIDAEYRYLIFYLDVSLTGEEDRLNVFKKAAQSGSYEDAAFTFADSQDEYLIQYFNLQRGDLPTVRILQLDGDLNGFVGPSGEITEEVLKQMWEELRAGKLAPVVQADDDEDNMAYDDEPELEDESDEETEDQNEFEAQTEEIPLQDIEEAAEEEEQDEL